MDWMLELVALPVIDANRAEAPFTDGDLRCVQLMPFGSRWAAFGGFADPEGNRWACQPLPSAR
jgi:hypothetical protein